MNILKNPLSIWLKNTANNLLIVYRNRSKELKIGCCSSLSKINFGFHNYIYDYCKLSKCTLGNFTYIASKTEINNTLIGSFCSIGPECRIGLGNHPSKDFISTHPAFFSLLNQCGKTFSDKNYFNEFEPIEIGSDVWLASRVTVIDGVKIGNGAIVAAGSVVTKDVAPYAIVGGVPAKVIRYRFTHDQIEFLEENQWWDFDLNFLQDNFKSFHNFESFKLMIEKKRHEKLEYK